MQRLCLCSLRKRLDQRTFGRKVALITATLLQPCSGGALTAGLATRWAAAGPEGTWGNKSCTGTQGTCLEHSEESLLPLGTQTAQE